MKLKKLNCYFLKAKKKTCEVFFVVLRTRCVRFRFFTSNNSETLNETETEFCNGKWNVSQEKSIDSRIRITYPVIRNEAFAMRLHVGVLRQIPNNSTNKRIVTYGLTKAMAPFLSFFLPFFVFFCVVCKLLMGSCFEFSFSLSLTIELPHVRVLTSRKRNETYYWTNELFISIHNSINWRHYSYPRSANESSVRTIHPVYSFQFEWSANILRWSATM